MSTLLRSGQVFNSAALPAIGLPANSTLDTIVASLSTNSGGGGSKNYLSTLTASTSGGTSNTGNGNWELGSTTGWSLAHSTLSSVTPTSVATAGTAFDATHGGSAASGNLSISTVTSGTQISGTYSGSLASSAASTAGDMLISSAFYIDSEDQAKILTIKAYYKVTAGAANLNFSGTSSNSFSIWIYDVTTGAWIQPAGVYGMIQNSGAGYVTATFQTTSTSTQYQLAIINTSASSGAYTILLDDISVGPITAPLGAAVTDWTFYTPSILAQGSNPTISYTRQTGYWRRVGDTVEIQANMIINTISGGSGTIYPSLPNGLVIDTTKTQDSPNDDGNVGNLWFDNGTTNTFYDAKVSSGNVVGISTSNSGLAVSSLATNDQFAWRFSVPIVGWSSNVQMSNDTDTRVVAMNAQAQTPSGTLSGVNTVMKFTPTKDTHSAYSSSTGLYTVPVSGWYSVVGQSEQSATYSVNSKANLILEYNGSTVAFGSTDAAASQTVAFANLSYVQYCNAGDTLGLYASNSGSGPSYTGSFTASALAIHRLSGPAVVASSELVASYGNAQSVTGTLSGSYNVVKYTATKDSHGAYSSSTGLFTAPVAGWYVAEAIVYMSATYSIGQQSNFAVEYNGTQIAYTSDFEEVAGTYQQSLGVSALQYCNAGDTLGFYSTCGGSTPSYTSGVNSYSIYRLKN